VTRRRIVHKPVSFSSKLTDLPSLFIGVFAWGWATFAIVRAPEDKASSGIALSQHWARIAQDSGGVRGLSSKNVHEKTLIFAVEASTARISTCFQFGRITHRLKHTLSYPTPPHTHKAQHDASPC
ncbi:unnamed protein product, partial [Ectocarpus sp. 13 AM-2016]